MAAAYTGEALPAASTSRDRFMAATVGWWLDRLDPDIRIVVMAHNAHIQRTPVVYGGQTLTLPMGLHLARSLGAGYLAVGLTSGAGRTAALMPAPDAEPYGFAIDDMELAPPEPGSIEADFEAAGIGLAAANLRAAPGASTGSGVPDRVRMDSGYIETPVLQAFDAIVHVPRSTLAGGLWF
ncbi:MAG: Erythromycin esterase [Syntrophorhabdus sp. PtaB.Bin184]|nr:MAG: Erythromycin esterase [Syntrophorhabdus sp. PtaB.Bin184]